MEIIKYNTTAANDVEEDDYDNLDAMITPVASIFGDNSTSVILY
jgi:hypothetical protein